MHTELITVIASFLIAYTSFWSSYILVGQNKIKSAYIAVLPALFAAAASYIQSTKLVFAPLILMIAALFFGALKLSGKSWCVSAVSVLIGVSVCLSAQIIFLVLDMRSVEMILSSVGSLLLPLLLWFFKIEIFHEDFIYTKEQKKKIFGQQFFFFPGLSLLIAWQIFLLAAHIEKTVYLMGFTILFHILILVLLGQQVARTQDIIENIIDKQYQSELLGFMRVIRSQRHDFNFHTQTIYGMIENKQFDECRSYVESLMNNVSVKNDILPLYNPAASALLNTFQEMAFQKGLQLDIEIHDNLQFISTSVFETNTILGNLLQNAIDELELHPEIKSRIIKILIIKRGSNNMIKVSNECHLPPEEMLQIFVPGFTTKESHEGLGLANALRIAEKYEGTVYPEFEGNTVHFIAKIPLK